MMAGQSRDGHRIKAPGRRVRGCRRRAANPDRRRWRAALPSCVQPRHLGPNPMAIMHRRSLLTLAGAATLPARLAQAEAAQVRLSHGYGILYLPLMVMRDRKLLEAAMEAGRPAAGRGDVAGRGRRQRHQRRHAGRRAGYRRHGGAGLHHAMGQGTRHRAGRGGGPVRTEHLRPVAQHQPYRESGRWRTSRRPTRSPSPASRPRSPPSCCRCWWLKSSARPSMPGWTR